MVYAYAGFIDQLKVMSDPSIGAISTQHLMTLMDTVEDKVIVFGFPLFFLFLLLGSLLMKMVIGRVINKRLAGLNKKNTGISHQKIDKPLAPKEKIVYRVDKYKEKRLYAHLLSAFQREGRMVDFLFENLDAYEDDQIGAAVRNIHEQCKNVLDRHVRLKPALDKGEGERFTVQEGYDAGMIRLVGNVKGEPPFEGIIRHRGWQITKLIIPDFTGNDDSGILEPAEIEIQ